MVTDLVGSKILKMRKIANAERCKGGKDGEKMNYGVQESEGGRRGEKEEGVERRRKAWREGGTTGTSA